MSIRNKTLLFMLAVFLGNLLLLGGYYQFYLKGEVSSSLQNSQSLVEEVTRQIADLVEQTQAKGLDQTLSTEQFNRYEILVTDAQNGEVLFQSTRKNGDLQVRATAIARVGERLLLVETTRYFMLGSLRALSLVRQILVVEIVIMAIILALIAGVLQVNIIRPLVVLNRRMQAYRQGRRGIGTRLHTRRDELGQLEQEFDRLTGALDEEKKLQERIIASISHDIKTPLTSVMGYVERLLKGNIKDEARRRQYLQTIYDRSQSINELVAEFDGYVASNSSSLKMQPLSAAYLGGLLQAEYQEELAANGVMLSVENTSGDATISGDLGKLRRVFGNLIGNAMKHANPAGDLRIHIGFLYEGDTLRILFQDNGVGVPPQDMDHIFEPFFTGNASRETGSGLGLSICRSIVQAHGGTIRATSLAGKGLCITIDLPIKHTVQQEWSL